MEWAKPQRYMRKVYLFLNFVQLNVLNTVSAPLYYILINNLFIKAVLWKIEKLIKDSFTKWSSYCIINWSKYWEFFDIWVFPACRHIGANTRLVYLGQLYQCRFEMLPGLYFWIQPRISISPWWQNCSLTTVDLV